MQYIHIHHDYDNMRINYNNYVRIYVTSPTPQAVVRAMDTVTDFARRVMPGMNITKFVIAGLSKVSYTELQVFNNTFTRAINSRYGKTALETRN